jgi:hypothetical protein
VAPAKLRRSLDVVPVFGVVVEFRADAKELRDPRRESKGWRAPPPSDVRPAPCDARRAFHSSNCLRRSCAASFPLGSGARNDIASCAARPALPQCFRETSANGHFLDLDSSDLFPRSFAQSAVPSVPDTKSRQLSRVLPISSFCDLETSDSSQSRVRTSASTPDDRPWP